jgi:PAS domain S-box-containing protein
MLVRSIGKSLRSRTLLSFICALIPLFFLLGAVVEILLVPWIESRTRKELANVTELLSHAVRAGASVAIRNHLKGIAEHNREIAGHHLDMVARGLLDRDEAIRRLRRILLSQKVADSGYLYCIDSRGIAVVHPAPDVQGTDNTRFASVREQMRRREGYMEYDWKNPGDATPRPKALYMVYFEPLDWIISASSYRSEFSKLLDPADFRDAVLSLRFGTSGYAYVIDAQGEVLIHPSLTDFNVFAEGGDEAGFVRTMLDRGAGFIEYDWRNADEPRPRRKLAAFATIPELGWTVVASAYRNEVLRPVRTARTVAYVGMALLVLGGAAAAFFLSAPLSRPLEAMVRRLDENARLGREDPLPVAGAEEIARLGREFNNYTALLRERNAEIGRQRAKYQSLFETAPDAVFLVRGRVVVDCNPATCDLFRGSRASLIGKTVLDLSPPTQANGGSSADRAERILASCREGTVQTFGWTHRALDGTRFEAEVRLKAFGEDGGAPLVVAFMRDVTERIQAERALRESEFFLKSVLESVQEGISILNPDLTIRHVNPIMADWYRERLPLVGNRCHEAYHGRSAPCDGCPALRCLRTGRVERTEVPGIPGSELEWLELFTYPMVHPDTGEITGIVEFVRDITARKRNEVALRESEARFRAMIQSSADMIFIIRADNRIGYVSPSVSRILGYPSDALVGTNAFERVHPDDLAIVREELGQVFQFENDGIPTEFRFRKSDGEWVVMEALGSNQMELPSLRGVVITARDITRRKRIEQALRENEENLRVTLASIGDGVIAADTRGRVKRMNPVAETLTGWPAAEAAGKPLDAVFSVVDIETRGPVEAAVPPAPAGGTAPHRLLLSRKGREFRIAHSGAPIRDDAGRTRGVVIVFRDVTEEYALQEELHQSRKMDAVGQLAGGVAHDFNNMLGGIMGAADVLKLKLRNDADLRRFLDMIADSVQRASDLTAKLLTFARKQSIGSTPVDVHDAVREAVSLLENTIDRRIRLESRLDADASVVVGDLSQLQNAFLNLGINAAQAMPEGGALTFASRRLDLSPLDCSVDVFDLTPGPYVEIEIRDTGCGIPAEELPRIFDPFFTTKPEGKGTGLGLSAVFGTVRRHGGAVRVYSEEGRGTVFRIWLPVAEDRAVPAAPSLEAVPGNGRVLVVDDEPVMRATAEAILTELGYEVLLAENGREGLERFQEAHAEIDLVLLDMIMPEMNGRDCFLAMRKIDPEVRVVLSSGFTMDEDLDDLRGHGLRGFVRKPYRVATLSRALADARVGKDGGRRPHSEIEEEI